MTEKETIRQLEERNENIRWMNIATFIWIACLLAYLLISYTLPLPSPSAMASGGAEPLPAWTTTDWGQKIYETRSALTTNLITFMVFSLALDLISRRGLGVRVERAIVRAVVGNRMVLDTLSVQSKSKFVENSLVSTLGDEVGSALYSDVVEDLIREEGKYRKGFRYTVAMLNRDEYPDTPDNFKSVNAIFDPDKYRWMSESVEYQLFYPARGESDKGPFKVAFVFDAGSLREMLNSDDVFFRSLIELEPSEIESFFALSDEEILEFLTSVLEFSAIEFSTQNKLAYTLTVDRKGVLRHTEIGCPVVYLHLPAIENHTSEQAGRLRISYRYPHHIDATHFTFSIPQPCENPQLQFITAADVEKLEPIMYLSRISQDRINVRTVQRANRGARTYDLDVNGWVFPTSGITFSWKNADR